ncbi:DNA-methyltransferase [Fimbriiglobus ruber]|uniref:Methyltransferase n=1 Tax=Fimbriiglobus ruber TaxID=1908690 RepID=A0A225E4E7_9BACT|nr:site-specific DNA-methyltransferase [Fimbriiglobus ruber]OWK46634.1 DNA methylase N-4/N-6 [Fimbriiglobus ruber]
MNLTSLEIEILQLHNNLNVRPTVETARRIGNLLSEARAQLGHGKYLPWVSRLGISRQTASAYTQIAKADIENDQSSGHLSIDGVLKRIRAGRRIERAERAAELSAEAADSPLDPAIICGDSLKWLGQQADNSVPFFVTDPPYGLGTTFDNWTDPDNPKDYWKWLEPFWNEMARVVQPGGSIVMWQAYHHLAFLQTWIPKAQIIASCFTIRGVRQWEPIVRWVRPGRKSFIGFGGWNDWMNASAWYRGESGEFHSVHPCPKALNDCREVVRRYTLKGKLVVDPFAGIGTIPLACQLEGRDYVGIDRSATYCGIARKRLSEAKKPAAAE